MNIDMNINITHMNIIANLYDLRPQKVSLSRKPKDASDNEDSSDDEKEVDETENPVPRNIDTVVNDFEKELVSDDKSCLEI